MFELGISVADEALRVRREAEGIEPSITSQPHLVQDFGPVQERQGLGRRGAEVCRIVRDDDGRAAAVADRRAEVRRIVVYRAGAVVALDRVRKAERALEDGHVVLLTGARRRVRQNPSLIFEAKYVGL